MKATALVLEPMGFGVGIGEGEGARVVVASPMAMVAGWRYKNVATKMKIDRRRLACWPAIIDFVSVQLGKEGTFK